MQAVLRTPAPAAPAAALPLPLPLTPPAGAMRHPGPRAAVSPWRGALMARPAARTTPLLLAAVDLTTLRPPGAARSNRSPVMSPARACSELCGTMSVDG